VSAPRPGRRRQLRLARKTTGSPAANCRRGCGLNPGYRQRSLARRMERSHVRARSRWPTYLTESSVAKTTRMRCANVSGLTPSAPLKTGFAGSAAPSGRRRRRNWYVHGGWADLVLARSSVGAGSLRDSRRHRG